jgi:hypothetical protein
VPVHFDGTVEGEEGMVEARVQRNVTWPLTVSSPATSSVSRGAWHDGTVDGPDEHKPRLDDGGALLARAIAETLGGVGSWVQTGGQLCVSTIYLIWPIAGRRW